MTLYASLALTVGLLVCSQVFAFAQATPASQPLRPLSVGTTPVSAGVAPAADYRLHLSDRIELQFPFSPDYNESVTVQPDGRISLREVDPVQVAGKKVL